ncbi:MAG: DNA translocase FtsK, partial [Bacteroidetes bacterium]
MAKKTKAAPNPDELREEVEQTVEVQEVVKDERTTKVVGILLLAAAFLLFVAIASYCATWSEDQDKVLQFGVKLLATNDVRMSNQMGALGAYVSHHLVYNGFGLASFLFCSLFFVFGVNKFFGQKVFSPARTLRYITVGLVIISMSFSFLTKGASFAYGGAVGDYLNSWLEKWIGRFGTGTLILLGLASYGIWRFNPTFTWPKWEKKTSNIQPEEDEMIFPTAPAPVASTTEEPAETNVPPAEQGSGFTPSMNTAVTPIHLSHIQPSEEPAPVVLNYFEKQEEPQEPSPKPIESFEQEIPLSVDLPTEAASALPVTSTPLVHVQMPATANAEPTMLDTYEDDEDDFVEDNEDDFVPEEIAPHNQLTLEIKEVPEEQEEIPVAPAAVGSLATNYDPTLDLGNYKHPHAELLETHGSEKIVHDAEELEGNKNQIIATLKNYSIDIQRISATVGPTVTLYEIVPAPGVRISKIKNLEDDIALSLSALGIRIIAPIPGKGTIGIEVPNVRKTVVSMKTLLSSEKFLNSTYSLPIAIGKKIDNENFIVDLATMPHLLVAGATGQGKSVGINALLVSLLFKKHPSQLKFVLVDPKKVELSLYRVIEKHFLAKLPNEEESIITDTKKVINTLNALCIEMDNRYDLLKDAGCRTIKEYNEKFLKRRLNPQKGHQFLPFIVLVVDEFADLIMTAGKEVEMPIARLAQLARAVGIHLIIATQR